MSIIQSRIPVLPGRLAALTQISGTTHDLPTSLRCQFSRPALLLEVSGEFVALHCSSSLATKCVTSQGEWAEWMPFPFHLGAVGGLSLCIIPPYQCAHCTAALHRSAKRMMASLPPLSFSDTFCRRTSRTVLSAEVQGWAKKWSLGCVNPDSWLPLATGGRVHAT